MNKKFLILISAGKKERTEDIKTNLKKCGLKTETIQGEDLTK